MPQAQDNARFVFIVLLIIWLNAGNDNGTGLLSAPSLVAGRLYRQRAAYTTMANSSWGDFDPQPQAVARPSDAATAATTSPPSSGRYLNLTGFREEDGLAWDDLATFKQRCLEWSRRAFQTAHGHSLWDVAQVVPTWQNATGTVHGSWVRQACSVERDATSYNGSVLTGSGTWDHMDDEGYESRPLLEGYGSRAHDRAKSSNGTTTKSKSKYEDKNVVQWSRNITGQSGRMVVRITDNEEDERYESEDRSGETTTSGPGAGGLVRTVTATVNIEDEEGTGSSHDMRLHGVHWPHKGALMLATTSEKFAGIFGLPHLAPGEEFFRSSQRLLNRTLDAALRQRERVHGFGAPDPAYASPLWTSSVDETPEGLFPSPRCEYVMYLQIHPVEASRVLGSAKQAAAAAAAAAAAGTELQEDQSQEQLVAAAIRDIEHELRFPSGAPIAGGGGVVPTMQMSAMLYSPDCAYFIETKGPPRFAAAEGQHLRGLKSEVFVYEARLWMLGYAAVLGVQIKLLLGQVRSTYTPSTLGRASFYTVAMMLLADGMVFVSASAWTLTASASFLPSLAVTFAGFLSVTIGGGFLSEIYTAQEPERRRQRRRRQRERQERQQQQRQVSVPIIVPSDQDVDAEIEEQEAAERQQSAFLLPAPATANAPAAAVAAAATAPDTSDTPSPSFSSVAGRLAMLGLGLLFLSLAAMTWWASARAVYANVLAAAYLSMWVPQIVRNVERNSRRAFAWPFMVGQSAMRLAPVAYFWLRADNVLFARPDRHAFLALAAWVWVQLWVLAFQDAWEYHPVLREDAVEAGRLPIGLVSTVDGEDGSGSNNNNSTDSNGLASTNLWTVDCAICCEALDVPVIRMGVEDPTAGGVAGVLARRQYMVTPCRHVFHTACLEGWLRFRLQCPICREELPPL
ncbi:ring finger ubiquitin ligase [Grosmannia clavigera kw1407]|uniref:DSC E3 ubiquitin ligase complex subunit A n=1 Tax=Grosmannia clavigera (strain kw1407 / UAMH 11150) TaxID=655863 RepID=F0XM41_GROCL|nr:ring finger ubiquitin ligase [Grosmannia clavigera kw1407]EFX01464.1 ring finger ubiquitin ligase [Grosmannia clavigera kw1407]